MSGALIFSRDAMSIERVSSVTVLVKVNTKSSYVSAFVHARTAVYYPFLRYSVYTVQVQLPYSESFEVVILSIFQSLSSSISFLKTS